MLESYLSLFQLRSGSQLLSFRSQTKKSKFWKRTPKSIFYNFRYNFYQQTLNIDITRFEDLENLRMDLDMRLSIWKSQEEWEVLTAEWIESPFKDIDADLIRQKCEYYTKVSYYISRLSINALIKCFPIILCSNFNFQFNC